MPRFRPLVLELTAYASELLGRFEKCTAELIIEAIELRFFALYFGETLPLHYFGAFQILTSDIFRLLFDQNLKFFGFFKKLKNKIKKFFTKNIEIL